MSPPSVDLQHKSVSGSEQITVQMENAQSKKNNKKCLYIIITILVTAIVVTAIVFGAIAWNYHLFAKEKFDALTNIDGRVIPEHVKVDFVNKIIFVSNERNGDIDKLRALHNYYRKMIAFKDLTNGRCYIDRHDETFEEGLKSWTGREGKERVPPNRYFRYIREPIDSDVLRTFAGEHIVEHCADVPTHWIVDINTNDIPDTEVFTNKTVQFICGPRNICPACPIRIPPALEPKQLELLLPSDNSEERELV
ncbi:hypothetical protein SNE40_018885 [Patella caerulea]|uniref:BRICHOS domain-containing protein n=1 Tax=Patella caerulea TaxID=87958 RepID=A0AAN8PHB2_PATCE